MNVQAYLDRIGYRGSLDPTAETLRALQIAHLQTVPFENLSIHAAQPIVLDEEALFDKVVTRRRGGFCYELNGMFATLLRALGFQVDLLSAGVRRIKGGFGPEFDHLALAVTLAERWLADVGFGDSFREPLLLDERGEQARGDQVYRLDEDGDHLILMQRQGTEGAWERQYRFSLQPHELGEYEEMCRYHQTSPESHFTQKRVCTLATPDGRVTLSDLRLITTRNGVRQERMLESEAEHAVTLRELFGVVI
ncbi:MAG TPA: arylamine N-acetyltransferase [Thermoanaerobaculia bacterium]|nr:arylamine N-acetyltransferase [Thermoanaerobaculia bacterium]